MPNTPFLRAHALLIGIAEYQDARSLPHAVIHDVEDVAELLRAPERCGYDPDKVRILKDASATKAAILAELDHLAATVTPEDTVCIYFSGHGWRPSDSDGSFLLPADVRRSNPAQSAISAELFSERLHAIKAARMLVFLDACHAAGAGIVKDAFGTDLGMFGLSPSSMDILSAGTGRAILASSRAEETSLILPDARNSVFTTALIAGLRGAADFHGEGYVKLFSLHEYLADRVPTLTADRQHPILRTKLEKNFVIALSPASQQAGTEPLASKPMLREALATVMPTLYPAGPIDRDVWERAGGDLAEITLNKPGRSMWFEALKLLAKGGGGDIDAHSLVTEALKDYPRNEHLLALS